MQKHCYIHILWIFFLASGFLALTEILSGILPSPSTACTDSGPPVLRLVKIVQYQDTLYSELKFARKATTQSRWQFHFMEESDGHFNTIQLQAFSCFIKDSGEMPVAPGCYR